MNLFITNSDPKVAANDLCDIRTRKIILECAQMLSTALHILAPERVKKLSDGRWYYTDNSGAIARIYGVTHKNHPVNLWVRCSKNNMVWAIEYAKALCDNYRRYKADAYSTHASESVILLCEHAITEISFSVRRLTQFPNCARNLGLGLDFTDRPVFEAYALYLRERWSKDVKPTTFKNRQIPNIYYQPQKELG